jgi:hypothetical protein
VFCRAGERGVVVVGALVAHFQHRDGVHDEACCHARRRAGSQVRDIAQLRQRRRGIGFTSADARARAVREACCDGQAGEAGGVGAHAVEHAEVEGAAEAGADHRGGGAAPELADWVWAIEDLAQGLADGGGAGAGLLDAGFEQVGGLEEEGGCAAGAEAGEEVEAWEGNSVSECLEVYEDMAWCVVRGVLMLKTIWVCIGIGIDNIPVDAFFRSCAPWDMAAWCLSLHAAR